MGKGKITIVVTEPTGKEVRLRGIPHYIANMILPNLLADSRTGWKLIIEGKLNVEIPRLDQYELTHLEIRNAFRIKKQEYSNTYLNEIGELLVL